MATITPVLRQDECISHALLMHKAWITGNYKRFFSLYMTCPRMAGYLVDKFAERERKDAIKCMTKAYVFFCLYVIGMLFISGFVLLLFHSAQPTFFITSKSNIQIGFVILNSQKLAGSPRCHIFFISIF